MLNPLFFKKVAVDSPTAYFFLAFVAMAGLSYVNFLPGVVNALAGGIGFSDAEAGQIVALNGYGGIIGSVAAIFWVRQIQWQKCMFALLAVLMIIDLSTTWIANQGSAWINIEGINSYALMLSWRFLAGVIGGLCVGIAFSVLARLNNPDRAFGVLLFVQFSIGSVVIYLLPSLEAIFYAHAVFYVMAGFEALSLVFLLFVPALSTERSSNTQSLTPSLLFGTPLLLLLAILCYQISASGIWAYVGLIGLGTGITADGVSLYIATTGMLGLAGAMLPVLSGKRFGRLLWVSSGIALSILAAVLLSFSEFTLLYIFSMALLFFAWPAVLSYLLAVTAEIDSSGRLSVIAGVVSSIGLASGPLLASGLLDNDNFSVMLYTCALIFMLSFLLQLKPVRAQEKNNELSSGKNINPELVQSN